MYRKSKKLNVFPFAAVIDDSNTGMVIDVEHRLIVKNVYWPLLSDFVNILSQEKIVLTIIENKKYFNLWLRFLTLFQGKILKTKISLSLHSIDFFRNKN